MSYYSTVHTTMSQLTPTPLENTHFFTPPFWTAPFSFSDPPTQSSYASAITKSSTVHTYSPQWYVLVLLTYTQTLFTWRHLGGASRGFPFLLGESRKTQIQSCSKQSGCGLLQWKASPSSVGVIHVWVVSQAKRNQPRLRQGVASWAAFLNGVS